jgi:regulatory protein
MNDDLARCYIAAMRILGYRFNSEGELRRKLQAKKFERSVIDPTIERLRGEKWIDDERFAGAFVRTRMLKQVAKSRLQRELRGLGVSDEITNRVLAEHLDDDRQRADLVAVCEKRLRLLKRRHGDDVLETREGRNKLAAYLLKQGYDSALVQSVVKEIEVVDD